MHHVGPKLESMLRPCPIETANLDDVVSICNTCKLPQQGTDFWHPVPGKSAAEAVHAIGNAFMWPPLNHHTRHLLCRRTSQKIASWGPPPCHIHTYQLYHRSVFGSRNYCSDLLGVSSAMGCGVSATSAKVQNFLVDFPTRRDFIG